MKLLDSIALILAIIGGINWGLIGFFQFNLVDFLFGGFSIVTKIIYCLVGIGSLYAISFLIKEKTS